MKAPNEKLIETLFIYQALRCLEGSGGSIYAPSSREEYEKGYDATLMGTREFDELYLQFKTPSLLDDDEYSFGTYKHQHERLQDYPIDTAYYVTHLFRSVEQVQQAQREATDPLNFLEWYIAVEIGRLGEVQRFRYAGNTEIHKAYRVLYKLRSDRPREHPKRQLDMKGWMTGAELLQRFERNEVGTRMILKGEEDQDDAVRQKLERAWEPSQVCRMSPERAGQMIREDEKSDWGIALRKNAEPLVQDSESHPGSLFPAS